MSRSSDFLERRLPPSRRAPWAWRAIVVAVLWAASLSAQVVDIELRDGQDRLLRGARVTVRDVTGRKLDLRSTVDGRVSVPDDFRIAKILIDGMADGAGESDIDGRALLTAERPSIRVAGVQAPISAHDSIAMVRDAMQRAAFGDLAAAWRGARASLLKEAITQDRLNAIDSSLDEIEATRLRLLDEVGEPSIVPVAEVLARLRGIESLLVQWRDLRDQINEVARLVRTRPDSDAARRMTSLGKEFLETASGLTTAVRDVAVAADSPIANLGADAVEAEIDGLGLGRNEVQLRHECWLVTERGSPPVRCVTPAPAGGLKIEVSCDGGTVAPGSTTIPSGRGVASSFVTSGALGGRVRVFARCAGLPDAEVSLPVVFPWKSFLALLAGLASGLFLRNRLNAMRGQGAGTGRFAIVVDATAAVILLGLWLGAAISGLLPDLGRFDPRAGVWVKFVTGMVAGLIGLPFLNRPLERWLAPQRG